MDHLIGAYGLFWRRDEVRWDQRGWQLLGYRGTNLPGLRVCDFRAARGIYVLFNDHGAHYVGLADSNEGGIGARLHRHVDDEAKKWDRFCWFAFDDVEDYEPGAKGWSQVKHRDTPAQVSSRDTVRELEALLIQILGTHQFGKNQRSMKFLNGDPWKQLTYQSAYGEGLFRKIDGTPINSNSWWPEPIEV